jgi:hypothetical protein
LRARLEAASVALDLAAAHIEYTIPEGRNPDQEDAFRAKVRRALELAADLAALGEHPAPTACNRTET